MKHIYETPRLYARELTAADLPALSAILQDAETMAAYEHAFDDAETLAWLDKQLARYAADGFGLWAVVLKSTGEMLGQCGLTRQDADGKPVVEIGYLFNRAFWHNGYAIEAAVGSRRYAFETLGAREVYSIIRDTNFASMNVAIRCGMTVRGRFTKHYYGVDMPHYIFSVSNKE
ncbi:MAG: GNAT family N-acetyltransferase [Oscillospiraceae bacterium]|jgi:RimJ/RimL family protein N-acetyltransferase|nr:GNAT family N-acetyltransferase [Oscillospiraceae bacterium]